MIATAMRDLIVVLDPDNQEAAQIADWLRRSGLAMVSTARTCDEAIFLVGRKRIRLLVIDEHVTELAERRLLNHIAATRHAPAPAIVRLMGIPPVDPFALGRAMAAEVVQKPISAHDIVLRVGTALNRPHLIGQLNLESDLLTNDLTAARRMQINMLPTESDLAALHADCVLGIAGVCCPGRAVGGDFWGAWQTGRGRIAVALADFAGHGLTAALNTFRLHAVLSQQNLPRGLPARMMGFLNARLWGLLPRGHYATMVYMQLDPLTRGVAWCSAGGPSPIFVSTAGHRILHGRGLPLGIGQRTTYRSKYARLPGPGILCMFSDGLVESGAGAPDVPDEAIVSALAGAASLAAAGRLSEAAQDATESLQALRGRYARIDEADDMTAVSIALGPGKD